MSRIAFLPLFAGVSVSLLFAALVFSVDSGVRVPTYSVVNEHDIQVEVGSRIPSQDGIKIVLDKSGMGVIALPVTDTPLREYSFALLTFANSPPVKDITLFWKLLKPDSHEFHRLRISSTGSMSRWVTLSGIQAWTEEAGQLGIIFQGPPGSIVELEEISLLPFTAWALARATWHEWTSFSPWNLSSINRYSGSIARNALLYPVPSTAGLLGLCILMYFGVCRMSKQQRSINWRMVWGSALTCWILLDVVWQIRMFRQLESTYSTFAGKTSEEKVAASPDGELFEFIRNVTERIKSTDANVFLTSSVDYLGMRGAYYLYPRNVFWNRFGPELPDQSYIRRGDYIVIVRPSELRYDSSNGKLHLPGGEAIAVQRILSQKDGEAFRAL